MPKPSGLTIGRDAHYFTRNSELHKLSGPTQRNWASDWHDKLPEPKPIACKVIVNFADQHEDATDKGTARLLLFLPNGETVTVDADFSDTPTDGKWSWMARVA